MSKWLREMDLQLIAGDVEKWLLKGLDNVPADYFKVISMERGEILREKAFCYEWYHQCSCLSQEMRISNKLRLHGELDKSGYFIDIGNVCPDFLVHQPGSDQFNIAVVEVKVRLYDGPKHAKDLKTLSKLIDSLRYERGYLVFVNIEKRKLKSGLSGNQDFADEYSMLTQESKSRIWVIVKSSATKPIVKISLKEFMESTTWLEDQLQEE